MTAAPNRTSVAALSGWRRISSTAGLIAAALLAGCGGGDADAVDAWPAQESSADGTSPAAKSGPRPLAVPTLAAVDRGAPAAAVSAAGALVRRPGTLPVPTQANPAASAADGVSELMVRLTAAMASRAACASTASGMGNALAAQARYDTLDTRLSGRATVAGAWCSFLDEEGLWGAQVAQATPTRCAMQGAEPVCRLNVDLLAADGTVRRLGGHLAVTREAGQWKLLGHADPVQITAFATAQRERRIDGGAPVDQYRRGLVMAIPALPGLACARVSQSGSAGERTTLAYFKPYDGLGVRRLSLWRTGSGDLPRSLNPAVGDLRFVDDAYLGLPDGTAGDLIAKALERDEGSVRVALFADAACRQPLKLEDGRSELDVDVDGVPPLSTAQALLPWPSLGSSAVLDLRRLALNVRASANFVGAWTGLSSGFRPDQAMLCVDADHCGDGDGGRIGERDLRRDASTTTITLKNGRQPVLAADFKLLALAGRAAGGVVMLADFHACASQATGRACP